jgi:hypothetical protein
MNGTPVVTATEVASWFAAAVRRRSCPMPKQCEALAELINSLRRDLSPETIALNASEVELLAQAATKAQNLLDTMQAIQEYVRLPPGWGPTTDLTVALEAYLRNVPPRPNHAPPATWPILLPILLPEITATMKAAGWKRAPGITANGPAVSVIQHVLQRTVGLSISPARIARQLKRVT